MNELTTNINFSHYVIFHDKSTMVVNTEQANFLMEQSCKKDIKGCVVGNAFITFSSISKILNAHDYYAQYPEKAPTEHDEFIAPKSNYTSIEKMAERRQNAFRGILKGLKQFIDEQPAEGITLRTATAVYEDKLTKYKQLFGHN